MTPASSSGITIQALSQFEQFDAAVALQRTIWGYSDLDADSRAVLIIADRFIGQLFGAFDKDRLIGMALAFHTPESGRIHSHRVGVLPEYQNRGIGLQLKLAQREDAIAKGIDTIQWTFDPLQPRNAYFNITRLGGTARIYIPNIYGHTSSPLHGGLPTDRLLIEWHLRSRRVTDILSGRKPERSVDAVEVPLPPRDRRTDAQEQQLLRETLQRRFSEGYIVTGFTSDGDRDLYNLEKS